MVSIIIPNYNHSAYLDQRIETVLNQSYREFELILLDDFSLDNSRDIIEKYRNHPKVSVVVYNEKNSGSTFKQWNKGISLCKGKYIWIAESDDFSALEFVETLMCKLLSNDDLVLAYCDSVEVDEKNQSLGMWSRWQQTLSNNLWKSDFIESGKSLNSSYNYVANVIPNASCVIFKKQAFLDSPFKKVIEDLKFTGDWIMWFSIIQNSKVYYCHQPLNYFRYHGGTTRSNTAQRLANVEEHYKAIRQLGKLTERMPDTKIREIKFMTLYNLWNPSLKMLLSKENLKVLKYALVTDQRILLRLIKTMLKKINVI